jgi:hypothetical protein
MLAKIIQIDIPFNVYIENKQICDKLTELFINYIVVYTIVNDINDFQIKRYNDYSRLSDFDIMELIKNISNNSIN